MAPTLTSWRTVAQTFGSIHIYRGNITHLGTDAIVNAANSSLLGGGGVDGAIHRAAGPELLAACRKLRAGHYGKGLATGKAVLTTAGKLPTRFVIHTVGPVWNGGHKQEAERLANCYRNCLQLAEENQLASIAFPGISTGIYGYPKAAAATLAIHEVRHWLAQQAYPSEVVFVVFDEESEQLYRQELSVA